MKASSDTCILWAVGAYCEVMSQVGNVTRIAKIKSG